MTEWHICLKMLVPWWNCGARSDLSAFVGQWSIPRRPMEHVSAGFLEGNSPTMEKKIKCLLLNEKEVSIDHFFSVYIAFDSFSDFSLNKIICPYECHHYPLHLAGIYLILNKLKGVRASEEFR